MTKIYVTVVAFATSAVPALAQEATRSSWAMYIEGYIREFPSLIGG